MKKKEDMQREIDEILRELRENAHVEAMKHFKQHGRVTTYDHCSDVARTSYRINELLHLGADKRTLLTGAMLHDFYLYDWHEKDGGSHDWHGYIHAERARRNAETLLGAGREVQQVIGSHMWPLNLTRIPRSREAWIVCAADKLVSLRETLLKR